MHKRFVLTILLLCSVQHAHAWWEFGHMVVAQIARNVLEQRGKNELIAFLDALAQKFPGEYEPPASSFVQCATWPDAIRAGQDQEGFAQHFIDQPYDPSKSLSQDAKNVLDRLNKLYSIKTELPQHMAAFKKENPNELEQTTAVRWIAHLVGDIAQPMHGVTDFSKRFPDGDHGGNDYTIIFNGEKKPLHEFWDQGCGQFEPISQPPTQADLDYIQKIAHDLMNEWQAPQLEGDPESLVESWLEESYNFAKKYAYSAPLDQPLSPEYCYNAREIAKQQLFKAGHRLAYTFEKLLDGKEYVHQAVQARNDLHEKVKKRAEELRMQQKLMQQLQQKLGVATLQNKDLQEQLAQLEQENKNLQKVNALILAKAKDLQAKDSDSNKNHAQEVSDLKNSHHNLLLATKQLLAKNSELEAERDALKNLNKLVSQKVAAMEKNKE